MLLRVPAQDGAPLGFGAQSFVVLEYHDDGTCTVRTDDPGARPDLDGLLVRLGKTREPRERRALQRHVEQLIDRLDGAERDAAMSRYRGL